MKTRVWGTVLIAVAIAATRSTSTTTAPTPATPATETIATGWPLPWGLALLPDGTALVTLRDQGEVLHIAEGANPVSVGRPPGDRRGNRPSIRIRRPDPSVADR